MLVRTNRDPFTLVTRLLGVRPQVHLHGDDLPSTHTFTTWPGRLGSINGSGQNNPYSAKAGWAGRGSAYARAAHCWPSASQYVLFSTEATNYTVATAFTWILATKVIDTAAQRNLLMLGASATGNNFRGLFLNASDQFGMLSNRNGTSETDSASTAGFMAGQSIIIVSLSAGGNLLIWQRSAENGTVELVNTTHTMTGTLSVDRFALGAAMLNNTPSGFAANVTRYLACARTVAVDATTANRLFNVVEKQLGCPLPANEANTTNPLVFMPSPDRWYNAALQSSSLPVVDDLTATDNAQANSVVLTGRTFDFQNNTAASITSVGLVLPADASSYTLLASLTRVAGRSWSTGTNYNISSAANLEVTFLVSAGLLKAHYRGTLYSSGYDVITNWAAGERHAVALQFDGTSLHFYVDDMDTPVSTHAIASPVRTQLADIQIGTFTGATGGWMHYAKDFGLYRRALSASERNQHFRRSALQSYVLHFAGDSNIADIRRDFYAPAHEGGLMWQLRRHVLPRAGLKTVIGTNRGQSGQKLNSASAIAPTSLIADGATLDAGVTAGEWNIGVLNILTNDAHEPTYSGDMSAALVDFETYLDTRLTTGLWVGFIAMKLPPSRNSTTNTRINTLNTGFDSLVTSGKLLATVPRASDDPFSDLHFLPQASDNDARHWTPYAQRINAESLLTVLSDVLSFHD